MNSFLDDTPRVGLVGNHEHRPNLMGWVQLAVLLPCFIVGFLAHAADKGAELANGSVVANECLSEKCARIWPIEVGAVETSLFKESERRVKDAPKVIGRNAESSSILSRNGEPVRYEQHTASAGDTEKPKVCAI